MANSVPDATCTLSPEGTVTTVRVGLRCRVIYEFNTEATSAGLSLPYVVEIDGEVLPEYANKPGALSKDRRNIELVVKPGSKVALYLNSDVHPAHRRHPVYAVQVGKDDVLVKITERTGRSNHERPTLGFPRCQDGSASGKLLQVYDAALTGDIWMLVSHLYTPDEADALLPPDTHPVVRAAVRSIYAGLPRPELVVNFPASDSRPRLTLRVEFREEMQHNVLANISYCHWLKGILPRTHPFAYAALLTEAHAAGVTSLRVTSGWRPSFGSIAHRAGLGLDITYVEADTQRVFINRASLTNPKAPSNGNVSEREKALWREYQDAQAKVVERKKDRDGAKLQLKQTRDPVRLTQLTDTTASANKAYDDASRGALLAGKNWKEELNHNEPELMRTLRRQFERNKSVKQIFDPWYMEANTADDIPPLPNEQRSSNPNERTHNNHLHITILEPKIL